MAGFIHQLQHLINQSVSSSDIDTNIARCMLENMQELMDEDLSISEVADLCYASTASISRFVRKIGFSNYKELQKHLQYIPYEQKGNLLDLGVPNYQCVEFEDYVVNLQEEINLSLETFSKNIKKEDVENLAREIYESERVILLASHTTGNIAEIFQLFLLMAGKFVEYYPQRHEQLSIISDLDENVLVLVFSIEGAYAQENEIMIPLMNSEARSILITQTSKSLYQNEFDDIIELAPYVGLQSGKYKLLYFLEIVLHVYYDLYVKKGIK